MSFILIIVLLSGEKEGEKRQRSVFWFYYRRHRVFGIFLWCFCCCPVDSSWPLVSSNGSSPNGLTTSSSSSSSYWLDDMNMCANEKKEELYLLACIVRWIGYLPAASNRLLLNGDNDSNDSDYPPNTIASVWHTGTHKHLTRLLSHLKWVSEIWNMMSEWARECQLKSVLIHSNFFVIYWLSNDYSKGQQREWLLIMFFPWKTRLLLQERCSNNNFIILVKSRIVEVVVHFVSPL